MLGKAASKSASLMKDMDEQKKKARYLQAEIALPCFMCTHDHPKYLAMEQYYYNKGRAIVYASEENLMRVKSTLQQCKTRVEQGRTCVRSAEVELNRAKLLLAANRVWTLRGGKIGFGSQEDVDAAQSALERYNAEFQKAQSTLKKTEKEKIQAEVVQACLMRTLSKHLAMDQYYYSKEGKINSGSAANLVTGSSSALQQKVEKARTDVIRVENEVRGMIKDAAQLVGTFGGTFYEEVSRIKLERCKQVYQKAQDSLKFEQEVDTEIDTETCAFLRDHGWYYCNKESTRQRNAAEVNRAIVAKRSALQQCQEQVELARTRVRSAENELRRGLIFGSLLIAGMVAMVTPIPTVAMVSRAAFVSTVAMGMNLYLGDKSTLERCKKDYQRVQNSLREIEHDFDRIQVELDNFTHLKRPKLVPVEWRYFYRHRHIVLTDVKVSKAEIEVKMNTRLRYYFSKFRNFF